MQIRVAKVVSYIFHPLLMPLYLLALLFNGDSYLQLTTPQRIQNILYLLVGLTTVLLPVSTSYMLLKSGHIHSLHMHSAQERRIPYLLTCLFYFFTYYLLRKVQVSALIYLVFLGASLALLITLLINLRWKISAHMVGIGGLLGALAGLTYRLALEYQLVLLILILVAGTIGTARMLLEAHSPAQLYSGFFVGVISQLALYLLI